MTHFGRRNLTNYHKAIRDKIPEIIGESGGTCNVKTLDDKEFLIELDKKLEEELQEYQESKSVEELADMLEVIQKIIKLRGKTLEEFEQIKEDKKAKRGGFEKNLFLIDSTKLK
jgi:predicted house-cleaning noncanonical NTP pyrophosphatase (MazG superfamily)